MPHVNLKQKFYELNDINYEYKSTSCLGFADLDSFPRLFSYSQIPDHKCHETSVLLSNIKFPQSLVNIVLDIGCVNDYV